MPLSKVMRNTRFIPVMDEEGFFSKPLVVDAVDKYEKDLTPNHRLFSHHTLSSVRKYAFYHIPNTPKDSLDLCLQSSYNHTREIFPFKEDVHLQWETRGKRTWRKLRNTYDEPIPQPVPLSHPIKYGGITERRSPHNIKLMNSGIHSAKTAPGYSRQPAGGSMFYY